MPSECITSTCHNPAAARATYRGLCLKCYGKAKKMVEAGTTYWAELEKLGMALEAEDPFTIEFHKRTKGK